LAVIALAEPLGSARRDCRPDSAPMEGAFRCSLWHANPVDGEQLVTSQRQAARLLDMRPSSVFHWRRTGKLGPAPWTLSELLAVRNRPDAPPRRRGVSAAHGTLSRVGAGCNCADCRAASAASQRERREAESGFPPDSRTALLHLLGQGLLFKHALAQIGVRAHQVWGSARSDPAWGAELQATIDRARPAHIEHGRQSAYRVGCRCTECRAAR